MIRLMTWNVHGHLSEAVTAAIAAAKPDLLVLTECPPPSHEQAIAMGMDPTFRSWRGQGRRGVSVMATNKILLGISLEQATVPDGFAAGPDSPAKESVLPWLEAVDVTLPDSTKFALIAAWPSNRERFRPLTAALQSERWKEWIAGRKLIVAGDFNNHWRWDTKAGAADQRSHASTDALLAEHGSVSAFHRSHGVAKGDLAAEPPTMWTAYDAAKGFHIDYVYAPEEWIATDPAEVRIGTHADHAARRLSDHAPVIVDLRPC